MEIPFRRSTGFGLQPLIKRMRRRPLNRQFIAHRKINIEIDRAKFRNLVFAARLLATEIIARHAKHN